MTCIVGIVDNKKVIIGADSAGVAGLDLRIRRDAKAFTNGDFVFGCTSSFRMIQLLQYKLTPPKRHSNEDVMSYMATTFIDAVRDCFKSGGFAGKTNEVETGGTFLVGYCGRLFQVHGDYQVAESTEGYDACGCGESYALGSLYATSSLDKPAPLRITEALQCSAHFSAGVCAPYMLVEGGAA